MRRKPMQIMSSMLSQSKSFVVRTTGELPVTRIPIWLQLAIATMFILAVSAMVLSYVVMDRQKEKLYDQTVKLGMVSLNYFSSNAKVPLLNDDILELNTLINNADTVDGHFYAFIINTDQVIKAHTDHDKIESVFTPFENVENVEKRGHVTYFQYVLPRGQHVLNLNTPIIFKDKKLGEVHVGLSTDFIRELIIHERAFLACATLVIIVFGMIGAVGFGLRFSKPISQLVRATSEIGRGNYRYSVDVDRNDELGTLGQAFNKMGDELQRQSIMKESFGKYVGSDVLDMILKDSEKGWLKGRKTEASILFADIRGFTAYSESKEPEEVVGKLNEFFAIATKVILKHEGYVDKFIGDSVLAVFGVPLDGINHEERCLITAYEMQQELRNAFMADGKNVLLDSVGIGISSGVVVAGNIGSQVKTEYTVIGDCVNVASYLNGLAGPGEIVVGSGVAHKCKNMFEMEPLPPKRIKGKETLVEMYKVVHAK